MLYGEGSGSVSPVIFNHPSLHVLCLDVLSRVWIDTTLPNLNEAWCDGVGYSGQPVTRDLYNLSTWFRPSSSYVVCAESFFCTEQCLCAAKYTSGAFYPLINRYVGWCILCHIYWVSARWLCFLMVVFKELHRCGITLNVIKISYQRKWTC